MKNKNEKGLMLKFSLLLLLSAIAGASASSLLLNFSGDVKSYFTLSVSFLQSNSSYLIFLTSLLLIYAYMLFKKGLNLSRAISDEDENVFCKVNCIYSKAVNLVSISQILSFMFFGIVFSGLMSLSNSSIKASFPLLLFGLIAFIFNLFFAIYLQNKIVKAIKLLDPNKDVSVFDLKFQDKWFSSCDEAEKQHIGFAAYTSYKKTCTAYPIAFLICFFVGMIIDIGIVPYILISVLWLIQVETYYNVAKLDSSSCKNKP